MAYKSCTSMPDMFDSFLAAAIIVTQKKDSILRRLAPSGTPSDVDREEPQPHDANQPE